MGNVYVCLLDERGGAIGSRRVGSLIEGVQKRVRSREAKARDEEPVIAEQSLRLRVCTNSSRICTESLGYFCKLVGERTLCANFIPRADKLIIAAGTASFSLSR